HCDGYSPRCSCTNRTARSRTSGENLLFLLMAPFSQRLEPPQNSVRFNTLLAQVNGKDSESVVSAVVREIIKLPLHLRQSLTWDRGMEMAKHRELHLATNMMVYFCDPQSPWQRGTNENTNRLLRQYYPKKTPLGHLEQKDLDMVASELNERPRTTLGFLTPADVLSMTVALTG